MQKKKSVQVEQYAFETKNLEGASQGFLDKTAPLIGYIVHAFNTLEAELDSTICQLINDRADSIGLAVIFNMSYASKVELFKRLIYDLQFMLDKELSFFDNLIRDFKEAGKLRNNIVHSEWETSHDDGYTLCKLKQSKKSGFIHEYIQYTEKSLKDILEFIENTSILLDDFDNKYQELWHDDTV